MTPTISKSCRSWLRRLAKGSLLSWFLAVTPVPAARPRVGRWGTYYPKRYAAYRREAGKLILDTPYLDTPQLHGPLGIYFDVIAARPKTSKRTYPRGDIDNFAKGPLDLLTEHAPYWEDDDQVVLAVATKRFAEGGEEPGVGVHWFELTEGVDDESDS